MDELDFKYQELLCDIARYINYRIKNNITQRRLQIK